MRPGAVKPLIWIASSKKNLLAMPDEVQDVLGFALHQAQIGGKSDLAKPLKRFGSAGILEIVEDSDGDAYRAVYTVRFENAVYVLHCFQKKSVKGNRTPTPDMNKIRERLQAAEAHARGIAP